MNADTHSTLLHALQNPALFNHPVTGFELIETHISWILLTGSYAYKLKKPVSLGFADFSTLAKRRFYSYEELRLNRRLAPSLYLEVLPITGSASAPVLGGPGEPFEYALKMVQFPQSARLDHVLERGELQPAHIDQLVGIVAAFHRQIAVAGTDRPFGRPERLVQPMRENFEQILPLTGPRLPAAEQLDALRQWTERSYHALHQRLTARKHGGCVRECHGDMHLANMALVDGRILIFDCLEFNENLRWIDTISEVAFLVMDLAERGRPELAHRALNGYLEITGDYRGLAVLRFYQLYRAMVRAKVAAIRLHQSDVESAEGRSQLEQFRGYLALAQTYTQPQRPLLVLTHGLSGSGKSTWTQALLECWGAIRLRSDSERKRLFELAPTASSGSGLDSGLYSRDASALTYRRLADLAADVLAAGHPVIVDATFLEAGQRRAFRELAERLGLPWVILDFTAPEPVLRRRIVERMHTGRDASEASLAVLDHQLAMRDPLDDNERAHCVLVDTERPVAADGLLGALSQMTERLRR